MTVVVAVLCDGGVVVGTDSSATCGGAGLRTIEQPCRKIEVVRDEVILAGTGEVGLGQRFVEIADELCKKKVFSQKPPLESSRELCRLARADFESTGACKHVADGRAQFLVADYGALVAFPYHNQACLIEFAVGTLQPEMRTAKSLWHGSLGSGQPIADPFLGLMRRTFCPGGPPTLATGRFIVCWTLEHTIDVNPGGINGPVELAVVEPDGHGQLRAREVPDEELQEHLLSVVEAEKHLASFANRLEQVGVTVPD